MHSKIELMARMELGLFRGRWSGNPQTAEVRSRPTKSGSGRWTGSRLVGGPRARGA